MKLLDIREGATGILYVNDKKNNITYYIKPNCDLNETRKYLYDFYNLKINDISIKEYFIYDKINMFSSSVSPLFWSFFYMYVKYKDLIDDYINKKIQFNYITPGTFNDYINLLKENNILCNKKYYTLKLVLNYFISLRNKIVIYLNKKSIIHLTPRINDFRDENIIKDLNSNYNLLLTPLNINRFSFCFFNLKILIPTFPFKSSFFYKKKPNITNANEFDKNVISILQFAFIFCNELISRHITVYHFTKLFYTRNKIYAIIGMDDCNYPYPFLYAAHKKNIISIGIQHGVYTSMHEAYAMNNINSHIWYDKLIVWGTYWKEKLIKINKLISEDSIIIGTNKHTYNYQSCIKTKNNTNKSILLPYEFLADTITIGNYIHIFMEYGFKIYFKPRKDESIDMQIQSYHIHELEHEIEFMYEITPESMSKIDLIIGTQTTLIYDLLPYNKPIWLLDTTFNLLDDLIIEGIARKISFSSIQNINKYFEIDVKQNITIDKNYFFNNNSILSCINIILKNSC